MRMHNPPHPGEVIKNMWLDGLNISVRQLAKHLNVSPSTLARLINGEQIFHLKWRFVYLKFLIEHHNHGLPCRIITVFGK